MRKFSGRDRRTGTMASMLRALALLAIVLAACAWQWQRPYHDGPVSDHFDGRRFFNPRFPIGKGLLDVVRWRLDAKSAEWPATVPLAHTARPPARVTEGLRATFVGHATVLVQLAGLNILTDPIWSERAFMVPWAGPKRVTPPGIDFADLPPIDVVLVSHNHYDHMDLPTLARLAAVHAPLFVVPVGNEDTLRDAAPDARIAALDWWQSTTLPRAARVHVVPVYHWSRRGPLDRNKALWGGFVVESPAGNLYVAGDTGAGDGTFFREAAARFGGFRLALLPVGAYEPRWFMKDQHADPAEAVQIHRWLEARTSLGVHLRTFQLTDEAYEQPEIELAAALRSAKITGGRFVTVPIGGSWDDATAP